MGGARGWTREVEIKNIIVHVMAVAIGTCARKASKGFFELHHLYLGIDKKSFKKRDTSGCLGVYVSPNVKLDRFISEGNKLITILLPGAVKVENPSEFGLPRKRNCTVCW